MTEGNVHWDLVVVDYTTRQVLQRFPDVILAQVDVTSAGASWERATALQGPNLEQVAVLWGPRTTLTPKGARLEGLSNLDAPTRHIWYLTQPRSL